MEAHFLDYHDWTTGLASFRDINRLAHFIQPNLIQVTLSIIYLVHSCLRVCVFVACKVVKSRLSLLLWKLISWKALDLLSTFNANYFLHHKNRLILREKIAHWIIFCYFFPLLYIAAKSIEKKWEYFGIPGLMLLIYNRRGNNVKSDHKCWGTIHRDDISKFLFLWLLT